MYPRRDGAHDAVMAVPADLMTRREVAFMLRVTTATVAQWTRRGLLPETRTETGKIRYFREDVEALQRARLSMRGR